MVEVHINLFSLKVYKNYYREIWLGKPNLIILAKTIDNSFAHKNILRITIYIKSALYQRCGHPNNVLTTSKQRRVFTGLPSTTNLVRALWPKWTQVR